MDPAGSRRPAQAGVPAPIGVTIDDPAWRRLVPGAASFAARAVTAARDAGGHDAPHILTSVILASDRTVRRLNARHRGRNTPTNVLTYDPVAPGCPGEIILALGTVRREAAVAGRRPSHHLAHLVVHGALHLAGHDHHHAGEARRMELAEARILHRLRVPNPWKRA
jgi:probable rRNA maturation factor